MPIVTLYRPVGPDELRLIAESAWTRFPPRLPEQPIFYPVLSLDYADQITRQWNVRDFGAGHVTEFDVDAAYLEGFDVKQVGGLEHQELWVPSQQLATFNAHIRGPIRVVRSYPRPSVPADVARFVSQYQPSDELFVAFDWNGKHAEDLVDRNVGFRRAVCEYFRKHKADTPLTLIAALYTAETRLAQEGWGVNLIVADLAQELLERGGVDYALTYFAGMSRGMDAFIQSGCISLSPGRRAELVAWCAAQRKLHAATVREKQYETLQERFAALPAP